MDQTRFSARRSSPGWLAVAAVALSAVAAVGANAPAAIRAVTGPDAAIPSPAAPSPFLADHP